MAGEGRVALTFRVAGKEPELWDPGSGRIAPVVRYLTTDDGRVTVPMTLPENGSVFVVFRNPQRQPRITSANGPARIMIEGRDGDAAPIQFWRNGAYTLGTSQDKRIDINIRGLPEPLGGSATLVAEPKDNRIMVSGSESEIARIEAIVRQLDPADPSGGRDETRVIRLNLALATEIVDLVDKTLNAQPK